jgi:hypothetical protein
LVPGWSNSSNDKLGIPVLDAAITTSTDQNGFVSLFEPIHAAESNHSFSAVSNFKCGLEVSPSLNTNFTTENFLHLDEQPPFVGNSPHNRVLEWEKVTSNHNAVNLEADTVSLSERYIAPSASSLFDLNGINIDHPADLNDRHSAATTSLVCDNGLLGTTFDWTTSFQDGSEVRDPVQTNNTFLPADGSDLEGTTSESLHGCDDIATLNGGYLGFTDLPALDFSTQKNFMAQSTYATEDINALEDANEVVINTNLAPQVHGVHDPPRLTPAAPMTFPSHGQVRCSQLGCPTAFKRDSDRIRH